MSEIIILLTLLFEVIMVLLSLHIAFNKRFYPDKYTVGIIAVNCLVFWLINIGVIHQLYSIIVYGLLWVYCYFRFELSVGKTIIKYVSGITIACFVEVIVSSIAILFQMLLGFEKVTFLSSIIALSILFFVYKIRDTLNNLDSRKGSKSIFGVAILYVIVLAVLMVNYYYHMKKINIYMLLILTFMFFVYFYFYKFEKIKNQAEKKQLELDMQKVYGEAYEELLQGVRKKQHDFKNQLGAIYSMHLVANSLDELIAMQKEYGDGFLKKCKYDSILTCCENSILAGYLYHRCIACEKEGVDIIYDVHVENMECCFALHEIIEILGILIDNACEKIKNIEDNANCIRLYLREENEKIIFSVSNRSRYLTSLEIEQMFKLGYSTKGKNRGIGLARVLELTKKNNSEIKVANYKKEGENWIEFSVIILK